MTLLISIAIACSGSNAFASNEGKVPTDKLSNALKAVRVDEKPLAIQGRKDGSPRNCWSTNPVPENRRSDAEKIQRIYSHSLLVQTKGDDWTLRWGFEERDPKTKSLYVCQSETKPHLLDKESFFLFDFEEILNSLERDGDLRGACFRKTDLRGANLKNIDLRGANLFKADLAGAVLRGADLRGAVLDCANLEGADLRGAQLDAANLYNANLKDAVLASSTVTDAIFETRAMPHPGGLEDIKGLGSLRYEKSEHGLALLRNLARQHGLRDQEHELTFALNHQRLEHSNDDIYRLVQRALFDLPSEWGRARWRPFLLLLGLIPVFTIVYWVICLLPGAKLERVAEDGDIRIVTAHPGYAFLFSLLSSFRIGWKELNIGEWILNAWPTPFTLKAHGWLRTASVLQSVLGLYLIALGVLAFFGRPFD